jgi:hypothetical protein
MALRCFEIEGFGIGHWRRRVVVGSASMSDCGGGGETAGNYCTLTTLKTGLGCFVFLCDIFGNLLASNNPTHTMSYNRGCLNFELLQCRGRPVVLQNATLF